MIQEKRLRGLVILDKETERKEIIVSNRDNLIGNYPVNTKLIVLISIES